MPRGFPLAQQLCSLTGRRTTKREEARIAQKWTWPKHGFLTFPQKLHGSPTIDQRAHGLSYQNYLHHWPPFVAGKPNTPVLTAEIPDNENDKAYSKFPHGFTNSC